MRKVIQMTVTHIPQDGRYYDVLYISRNLAEIFGLDDLIEHVWSEKIVIKDYDDWIAFGGIAK